MKDNPWGYWRLNAESGDDVQLARSPANVLVYGNSPTRGKPGIREATPYKCVRMGDGGSLTNYLQCNGIQPYTNATFRLFEGVYRRDTTANGLLAMLFGGTRSADQNAPYCNLGGQFGFATDQLRWAPQGNRGGNLKAIWDGLGAAVGVGSVFHMVLRHQGGAFPHADLFINGVKQTPALQSCSDFVTAANCPLMVGNWYYGTFSYPWVGCISDFAVYDANLSDARILEHAKRARGIH